MYQVHAVRFTRQHRNREARILTRNRQDEKHNSKSEHRNGKIQNLEIEKFKTSKTKMEKKEGKLNSTTKARVEETIKHTRECADFVRLRARTRGV